VARYNLDGQDAVHLASARYAGVRDFASFDARFRRFDDLVLWNDRIHTTS
jgi:predicted nucleic acid-binding protein